MSARSLAPVADAGRVLRRVHPADRRWVLILLLTIVVSVTLRLLTWNEIADGGQSRYVKTVVFGALAAAAVWALIRVQTPPSSRIPFLASAFVLFSGDAIHYVRLMNPITHGGPIIQLTTSFGDEAAVRRHWDFEQANGGRISFESGAIKLESPVGGRAYIGARLSSVPDVRVQWWLPVGLAERERTETFTWRARVQRTGAYYVVTEIRQLLIQVVSYGIHVTYPDERGEARGYEIQHPVGSDGAVHEWQLTRTSQQISLVIDGRQVWSAPQRGELGQARLGETKTDPLHAGTMWVEFARYASRLEGG